MKSALPDELLYKIVEYYINNNYFDGLYSLIIILPKDIRNYIKKLMYSYLDCSLQHKHNFDKFYIVYKIDEYTRFDYYLLGEITNKKIYKER